MRFLTVAVLGLLLVAPTIAHADTTTKGHSFGSATCSRRVPCPETGAGDPSDLAASASTCVTQNFGYSNSSGFFDESYGVDSDGCLSSKPGSIPKGMGAALTPKCCIIKMQDSTCTFHCDILSN